jgi:type II secretory pathway pseudopilin PulG
VKFQIPNFKLRIRPPADDSSVSEIANRKSKIENSTAFTLVEVLIVVSLMSLIVLALMAVFSSTQRAFRAAVTQTDVLEGSRAAVDLMASDLRGLTPSGGNYGGAVNFSSLANNNIYSPLLQSLPGATASTQRTNLLNYFFVLSRENTKWIGVGYVVDNTNSSNLYPLYRFYGETNLQSNPAYIFQNFHDAVAFSQWGSLSHIMDGVVHLTVRAYDTNGMWINNFLQPYTNNVQYFPSPPDYGEAQFYMYSNMVPASVELELGVIEDSTLQRAESLPNSALRAQYLADKSGVVHLFRQRVSIPNVDPTAYR